ncbi:MAG: hypothetical protein AAGG51_27670 [Cyanobacteria bacterium P01_G01_bin.54]
MYVTFENPLSPQETADFLSRSSIQNVLGRAVGGNPSVIEGQQRRPRPKPMPFAPVAWQSMVAVMPG